MLLKILFLAYNFYINPHFPADIIKVFCLDFRFSKRKSQNQKNRSLILQYRFAQNTSLILRSSTHLKLKIICSQNTAKNISDFTNFSRNMFLFGVRKNIWTASFLETQELNSWSTLKANACIFLCIWDFCSKDVVKFYLMGWVMVGGGMISSAVLFLPVWTSCTYILIFHFNWNFLEIQLSFSISILPSIALKRWNFPDSLDFNSKIMANFS